MVSISSQLQHRHGPLCRLRQSQAMDQMTTQEPKSHEPKADRRLNRMDICNENANRPCRRSSTLHWILPTLECLVVASRKRQLHGMAVAA